MKKIKAKQKRLEELQRSKEELVKHYHALSQKMEEVKNQLLQLEGRIKEREDQ